MKKIFCLIVVLFAVNNAMAAKLMFVDIDTTMANFENLELNNSELRDINIEIRRQLRDNLPSTYEIKTEQTVREAKGSEFIKDYEGAIRLGKKLGVDYSVYARLSDLNGYKLSLEIYDKEGNFVAASRPIEGKNFDGLLQSIRTNAGSICQKLKEHSYEDFTPMERIGTFVLNHALGAGSFTIQDNNRAGLYIAGLEITGIILYVLSSSFLMPDSSDYITDMSRVYGYNEGDTKFDKEGYNSQKDMANAFLTLGIVSLCAAEIYNIYTSFSYSKPKQTAGLGSARNFNLVVLPTRNGNGMAYGLMYNRRF